MAKSIECPSCGGAQEVHNPGITLVVCQYCSASLYWDEEAVLHAGEKSILVQGDTRLFDGARGTLQGKRFRVIGHVRYDWGAGTWDEWYIDVEGEGAAWLSEDERELSLERPLDAADAPAATQLSLGRSIRLGGSDFTVREIREARCVGGWGQLPFTILPNETYPYADLASRDGQRFATLEYDRAGAPRAFIGEPIPHDALIVEGSPPEPVESAPSTTGASVRCDACGASLQKPSGREVQTLVCEYCGTQNQLEGAAAKAMGQNPKGFNPRFMFEIGQRGNFSNASFEVIGRMLSVDDEGYEARQYLLWNPERGYLYLEEEAGKFVLNEVTLQAPNRDPFDLDEGDRVRVGSETFRFVEDGTSTLRYVDGALPWIAKTGDRSQYADFTGSGGSVYGVEKTAREIEYYLGTKLPRAAVQAAFGLQGAAKAGAHTNVRAVRRKSGLRSCLVLLLGSAVVMLLLVLLGLLAARLTLREEATELHASYLDIGTRLDTAIAQLEQVEKSEPWLATCAPQSSQWLGQLQETKQSLQALEPTLAELRREMDKDEFWGFINYPELVEPLSQQREGLLNQLNTVTNDLDQWLGFKRNLGEKAQQYRANYQAITEADLERPRGLLQRAEKDWPNTDHSAVTKTLAGAEDARAKASAVWRQHLPAHQQAMRGNITQAVCQDLPQAWDTMSQLRASISAAQEGIPARIHELYSAWEKQLVDMEIIEGYEVKFRHEYRTVQVSIPKGGGKPEGPVVNEAWEPVTKEVYNAMESYMGMAVAHKALGRYDSQAVQQVTPPGYSFMAPPEAKGNQLGRWQSPVNDSSLWKWLPAYAGLGALLWGTHHTPTVMDYRRYQDQLQRRQVYFGDRQGRPLFGNLGVVTALHLANSVYYRNNMFKSTRYITSGRTYRGTRYEQSYRSSGSSGSRFGGGK